MPSKTRSERQAEYEQRLRDSGYRRVQLWVLESDVGLVKQFCASLRE